MCATHFVCALAASVADDEADLADLVRKPSMVDEPDEPTPAEYVCARYLLRQS